jgi:hypothetical protein
MIGIVKGIVLLALLGLHSDREVVDCHSVELKRSLRSRWKARRRSLLKGQR